MKHQSDCPPRGKKVIGPCENPVPVWNVINVAQDKDAVWHPDPKSNDY